MRIKDAEQNTALNAIGRSTKVFDDAMDDQP
jgi:hypothetical protein